MDEDPSTNANDLRVRVVFGLAAVGFLGAVGMVIRPFISHRYAGAAARIKQAQQQRKSAFSRGDVGSVMGTQEQEHLESLLTRLRTLQEAHRLRHPTWYGIPDEATLANAAEVVASMKALDGHPEVAAGPPKSPLS